MLIHHLFYLDEMRPYYNDIIIHGHGLVNEIGIFSKLCVAVFVFVSGYGLAVSTPAGMKLKDFYWHRFKKLYLNYWFIWLLFVPIGVFEFGRTFTDAYGEHVALRGVLDFFGLLKMFGVDSYNPTWWFYSCIIVLYLLFPLLNKYINAAPLLIVSIAITSGIFGYLGATSVSVFSPYLLTFILGIVISKVPVSLYKKVKVWHLVVSLALLCIYRFVPISPMYIVDALICICSSILLYKITLPKWLIKVFSELGKHSMNMFLVHSFYYYYWFREYIYYSRNPIIIFITLLIISYLSSVIIEWIKRRIGIYKLI